MQTLILLAHNWVYIPSLIDHHRDHQTNEFAIMIDQNESNQAMIATFLSNLAYYGYSLDQKFLTHLISLSQSQLIDLWYSLKIDLDAITGNDKNMDQFVVYRNFPQEVLNLSDVQYWMNQIKIYLGYPVELFMEEPKDRPILTEVFQKLKVLSIAPPNGINLIYQKLKNQPSKWSDQQLEYMVFLAKDLNQMNIVLKDYPFKENGLNLIHQLLKSGIDQFDFKIEVATDVLRLMSLLSGGKANLTVPFTMYKLNRSLRQFWLNLLENTKNLENDISLRPTLWKRFLKHLHPGDYPKKFPKVVKSYDLLYRNQLKSFNQILEKQLSHQDIAVFKLLASRPGIFFRKVHQLYSIFGNQIIETFKFILESITTLQILKLSKYLATINQRKYLIYPPQSNWQKLQKVENTKIKLSSDDLNLMQTLCQNVIAQRLKIKYPNGISLSPNIDAFDKIKIPGNAQELASYGKGTVFQIPTNIRFIRIASYWQIKTLGSVWFDNSINAFDEAWQSLGTCCWNSPKIEGEVIGCVFSGDPVNANELKGRACQMIDLYLEALQSLKVRYLVWSLLSYNSIPFENSDEVLATLQWGEVPEEGKLYEPSRAQMVFQVGGKSLVKYVAYLDLLKREVIYLDANMKGAVRSAVLNASILSEMMPAVVEHLESLPSYADYLRANLREEGEVIEVEGCLRGNIDL